MIIIEMILLWFALIATVCMVCTVLGGHELAAPCTLVAVTLITMYITLVRYSPVIKDSVVFG